MDAAASARMAQVCRNDQGDEHMEISGKPHPENKYLLKNYTKYPVQVYEELGFLEFIASNRDKGDLSVNWNTMTVLGPEDLIKDLVGDFEAGIIREDFEIKVAGVGKLFFKVDGCIEDNILVYIRTQFQKKYNKPCCFDIKYGGNPDKVNGYVYCRSHDDASSAKSLIEKGFCSFQLGDHSKDIKLLIKEWKGKHKLLETDSAGNTIITCTNDVRQKIEVGQMKQLTNTVSLSSRYAKFLSRQESILNRIGQQRHVGISFIKGKNALSLSGIYADIKLALRDIKSSMFDECITIQENPSGYLASEFDKIADRNNCCWSVKRPIDTDTTGGLDGCHYIASWHDEARLSSLTVIQGDSCNLLVDCLIVLCTDKLFPLQFTPDKEFMDVITTNAGKPSYGVGTILIVDIKSANYRNAALLVVGSSHPASKESNKTFHGLSSQLKTIFKQAYEKQWKTICLSVHGEEDFISTSMVSDAYIEAVVDCQKQKMALHFYLFCDTKEDFDRKGLLQSIQKRYKKEIGFFRKVHERGVLEMEELEKSKEPCIEVAQGSIENMKTDIIVNTTSKTLDLRKGKVSQQLLLLAGDGMEKACKKQYPNGIDYTTIAVTSPFKLGGTNKCINYVFHAALRPFKRESYVQNIKIFIWCCLAEADRKECKSIAFPALGTGNLGYPRREVAKAMFDAVEEYRKQAVNPFVERVVFSLYAGDRDACMVFEREGKRRSSVGDIKTMTYRRQSNTELKPNVRKLIGKIPRKPHPVEVIVAVSTDIEPLDTHVVRIKWFESAKCEVDWKYCEDKPETENDELLVSFGESKQSNTNFKWRKEDKVFKTAITKTLTYCIENRIAEICFDIRGCLPSFPDDKKIEIIASELTAMKEEDIPVLHTVYVQLEDPQKFDGMKHSLIQSDSYVKTIISVFPGSSKVNWKLHDSSSDDRQVQIEIVGDSSDILQKVKDEMLHTAQTSASRAGIGSSVDGGFNGARPKLSVQRYTEKKEFEDVTKDPNAEVQPDLSGRYGEDVDSSYNSEENDVDDEVCEVFKVVSAQINAGFIKFKEKYNDFDRWRRLVEETYAVRLSTDRYPCYRVHGTYKQISDLKTYLDNEFPADPRPVKRKKKTKDSSKQMGLKNKPVKTSLTHENQLNLPISEAHFQQTERIVLPGGEMESLLFINIVSRIQKNESVVQMRYDEQQSGLVLMYNGNNQGLTRIKEEHKRYMQNVMRTKIKLDGINEMAQGDEAATAGMVKDKVICHFIPPEDTIVIVGEDDASARKSEQQILTFLGRPNVGTKQSHSNMEAADHHSSSSSSSFKGNQGDGGSHRGTHQAVCVKIYSCGVDKALSDGLVVPYSSECSQLAQIVYDAGGKEIEEELHRSIKEDGSLRSGECRATVPGELKNYKTLIHMCLDGTDNVTLNLLTEALLNSLNKANDLRLDKLAILLTGLNNSFSSLHAGHYFEAIKQFTQVTFKNNKVKEIHLIDIDDQRPNLAAKEFIRMKDIEGIKYNGSSFIFLATPSMQHSLNLALPKSDSLWNQQSETLVLGKSNVRVIIARGSVTRVAADGIVCFQDEDLSLTNPAARAIYEMCGQRYKSELDKARTETHTRECTILAVPTSGGGITCKYVINVVLPRWYPERLEEGFVSTLKDAVSGILKKSEDLGMNSLAIPPLASYYNLPSSQQNITEKISEAMASSIVQFYTGHEDVKMTRLEILVTEPGMFESLKTWFERIGSGDNRCY